MDSCCVAAGLHYLSSEAVCGVPMAAKAKASCTSMFTRNSFSNWFKTNATGD